MIMATMTSAAEAMSMAWLQVFPDRACWLADSSPMMMTSRVAPARHCVCWTAMMSESTYDS